MGGRPTEPSPESSGRGCRGDGGDSPMMEMGFRAKRRRPQTPTYLLRQPADQRRTTYSVPKKTTSTISCGADGPELTCGTGAPAGVAQQRDARGASCSPGAGLLPGPRGRPRRGSGTAALGLVRSPGPPKHDIVGPAFSQHSFKLMNPKALTVHPNVGVGDRPSFGSHSHHVTRDAVSGDTAQPLWGLRGKRGPGRGAGRQQDEARGLRVSPHPARTGRAVPLRSSPRGPPPTARAAA